MDPDPVGPDDDGDDVGDDMPVGEPGQPSIPAPTGTCPELVNGDVTFAPIGMAPRKVRLALDANRTTPGALVLYWHATFSGPEEAKYSLGATHDLLVQDGGVIAAPYSDDAAGTFEWFVLSNSSTRMDDFMLANEIVGCLVEAGRVDPRRIHSMGMSAGALQTTALGFTRSSYIASVVTYSGGVPDGFSPTITNPENKFAALIFSGGANDYVFGVDFQGASERYRDMLTASGHFAALCQHSNGHEIPLEAAPAVRLFFEANPFGAWPSPYATGLPASFPTYCQR
jgi:predicted esterase